MGRPLSLEEWVSDSVNPSGDNTTTVSKRKLLQKSLYLLVDGGWAVVLLWFACWWSLVVHRLLILNNTNLFPDMERAFNYMYSYMINCEAIVGKLGLTRSKKVTLWKWQNMRKWVGEGVVFFHSLSGFIIPRICSDPEKLLATWCYWSWRLCSTVINILFLFLTTLSRVSGKKLSGNGTIVNLFTSRKFFEL